MGSIQKMSKTQLIQQIESLQTKLDVQKSSGSIELKQFLDLVGVMIIGIDADQKMTLVNKKGCEILEYSEDEIIGKNWFDHFLPQWNIKEVKTVFNKIMSGKLEAVEYYENSVITKTGQEKIIAWHNSICRDERGKIVGTLSSGEDITERKQAEEALNNSEAFLDSIIEQSPHAMWISDSQGTLIRLNQACRDLLQITDDEVVGKYNVLQDSIVTEQGYLPLVKQVFEQGKTIHFTLVYDSERLKNLELDEHVSLVLDVTISPVLNADGQVIHAIIQHVDITEREQAKEALTLSLRNQLLAVDILQILNRANELKNLIHDIMIMIKETMDFDAVAIRLQEGEDFPYFSVNGFPDAFIASDNYLCSRDDTGEIIRDPNGNPVLECMCGNVLCGRINPSQPFFTQGGSFWTNSTTELLASTTEKDRQSRTRNRCHGEGFESVALIPLRFEDEILGLLQLNDHKPDRFTLEMVQFLEGLGASISVALKRNLMDEQIRLSEEALRKAQQVAHVGSWTWHIQSNYLEWSDEMFRIFGIEKEGFQGDLTDVIARAIHPEDRAAVEESNRSVIMDKKPVPLEYRIVWPDGTIRMVWAEAGELILDHSGQPVALTGIVQDITERKRAEEMVQKSLEQWKATFDAISDIVCVIANDHTFLAINEAGIQALNLTKEEIIGRKCYELVHGTKSALPVCPCTKTIETGYEGFSEYEQDGRFYSLHAWPLYNEFGKTNSFVHIVKDITERKRAEEEIKMLSSVVEQSAEGMAIADLDGNLTFVNNAWCRMHGYKSSEELLGKNLAISHNKEQLENEVKPFNTKVFKLGTYSGEVGHITRNGKPFPTLMTSVVLKNKQGKPYAIAGIARDITERIQAQHNLEASEIRYRRLFESAKDGILILNAGSGEVVDVNPFLIELLGYTHDEIIGKQLWDIGLFKDIAASKTTFFELLKKDYIRYDDLRLETKDKRYIDVEFVCNAYDVDNSSVIQCSIRDITTRKRTEAALDKERSLLKTLMDNIPDHIYFKDTNSRFITMSKSQAERFNLGEPAQTIGKTDFDFFTGEHAQKAFEDEQKIIRTGEPVIGIEEKETWSERPETWVSTTKMPLVDKNGTIIGTFGISRDITQTKQAEQQIRRSLKEKEILLRELYHRTKNNMQVISSMLRLRARAFKEPLLSNAFKDIENKILSMALVHQKLYESKDLSHLNLKDYIDSLISLINQSYSKRMNQVSIQTNMKDIKVLIDTAVPIGLVVNELLTNAFKHAFPDDRRGEIQVNLHTIPNNFIVLEISDNGIGLPKKFDIEKDIHLGLQTVFDLIEGQLDGKIKFTRQKGLHCRITFNEELYQPRV